MTKARGCRATVDLKARGKGCTFRTGALITCETKDGHLGPIVNEIFKFPISYTIKISKQLPFSNCKVDTSNNNTRVYWRSGDWTWRHIPCHIIFQ